MQPPTPPSPYGSPQPYGSHYPHPYGPGQAAPYGGPQPYPGAPYHPPAPPASRPPAVVGLPRPVAVAPVAGSPYGVALVEVRPTPSGPAVASLVTGLATILVSLVVAVFVVAGSSSGWDAPVAGAFALLALFAGVAATWLGFNAMARIRRGAAWGPVSGRGVALTGVVCGIVGVFLTGLFMLVALAA